MTIAWLDFYWKKECLLHYLVLCNKKLERNTLQRDKLKFYCARGDLKMTLVIVFVTFPETLGSYTFFPNFHLSGPAEYFHLCGGCNLLPPPLI